MIGLDLCCPRCEHRVCYCQGCSLDDGLDDLCDECWCAVVDEVERSFDAWMTKLERAARKRSEFLRRIRRMSEKLERWTLRDKLQHAHWIAGIVGLERMTKDHDA